jgi:hypothetical protein
VCLDTGKNRQVGVAKNGRQPYPGENARMFLLECGRTYHAQKTKDRRISVEHPTAVLRIFGSDRCAVSPRKAVPNIKLACAMSRTPNASHLTTASTLSAHTFVSKQSAGIFPVFFCRIVLTAPICKPCSELLWSAADHSPYEIRLPGSFIYAHRPLTKGDRICPLPGRI